MPQDTRTGATYLPWPINVQGRGDVNKEAFQIAGSGVIKCFGVYEATLNFSSVPKGFHPSAISTFVVSTCCDAGASARNGGRNMRIRGARSYESVRELTFDNGKLTVEGKATYSEHALSLDVHISGKISLPDDLIGHSVYILSVRPQGDNTLQAVGEGSLFRRSGEEVKVKIRSKQTILPMPLPDPIEKNEFRIATESGDMYGLSYRLTIHSVFDTANSMTQAANL